ncbi:oligosaccharide flippase family protein [Pseudotenacibaculum sp. MALMAid0570]|uniref:lipopolysaccharide biosynthesis protein n=1 Tax=Pseudotenacibaculum sp. MALMAid0570 TaxID=3143938 RepID=UPI0032E0527B
MNWLKKYMPWFDFSVFFKYAGGNIFFQIVSIVAEFAVLKLVDVQEIGIWQYALLLQGYVIISRLGIINAFNRDYPYLKSSEKDEKARLILSTTAFHVTLSMILQSCFFLLIGIYQILIDSSWYLVLTMFVMCFYTILEASANFEEAKLRASISFNKITLAKILVSLISLAALFFPYYLGYKGLLIRVILIQLFLVLFYKFKQKQKSRRKFYKKYWLELFKDGWKLWLWSYLKSFNRSLPKLFLVSFASLSALGLFTPVNWMLLSITLFTTSLNSYLYPNFSQRFAKGDKKIIGQSLLVNIMTFGAFIPIMAIMYISVPFLIDAFLPEYQEAILPMRIAMIASLFDVFSVSATVWVSMKDWGRMYFYIVGALILRLCSLIWLYYNQSNILYNTSLSILFTSVFTSVLVITMLLIQKKKENIVLEK